MKQYVKLFVAVGVSIAVWNTLVKRVPVAGPVVGQVLGGL